LRTLLKHVAAAAVLTLTAGTALAQAVTVTDGRGQSVSLDRPAQKVVTIPIPAAAILMALNEGPGVIAAMHPASMAAIKGSILEKIYPDAANIPTNIIAGGTFNPNVETVLTLEPDAVIQWASQGAGLIEPLEAAGLKVVGVNYGKQEDSEAILNMLGALIGKEDKAAAIIGKHRDVMAAIKAKAAAIPDADKPRVMYFLRFKDSLRPSGRGTYNDFYINLVGARNATDLDGLRTTINAEQVVEWNPDVILLGNFDPATPADVYANPLFVDLNAVKNKRVYKMPLGGYRWDPPSHESPLTWMWLAEIVHGDRYDFDIAAEMRLFYKEVYGYDLTETDIAQILQTDVNGGAAGYKGLTH